MRNPGDAIHGDRSHESATAAGLNRIESEICSTLNLDPKEFAAQKGRRGLNLGVLGKAGAVERKGACP